MPAYSSVSLFAGRLFSVLVFSVLFAGVANAALLRTVDASGKLTGATGVDVGGTLYDVRFVDGSCIDIFSGCNSSADFSFTSSSLAIAASRALLDFVLVDVPEGAFDTNPSLVSGCSVPDSCFIFIPYAVQTADFFFGALAQNYGPDSLFLDQVVDFTNGYRAVDWGTDPQVTFAVWTITSPLPEPSSLVLLGLSVAALGWRPRRRGLRASTLMR